MKSDSNSSLCYLCGLCVSVVVKAAIRKPQRHREHRGGTESVSKQPIYIQLRVEHDKIINLLADSGITNRQVEFLCDCDCDSTFRSSIKFSENDSSHARDFQKLSRLLESILSGDCIDYEQRLMRCAFNLARRDSFHFFQLGHQIRFGVEPAGSVNNQDFRTARLCSLERIEKNRGRISSLLLLNERNSC